MRKILGRRARLLVLVGAVALVAAGCVDFSGTKVITGEGTPTGDFVVEIRCETDAAPDQVEELTFQGEETVESQEFSFFGGLGEGECFITEIEQAGATTVTYQCGDIVIEDGEEEVPPALLQQAPIEPSGPGASLVGGNALGTVTCTETPDGLEIDVDLAFDAEATVNFTVINDFEAPPPTTAAPTTTLPEPAPVEAVAPAPVPAQVVTFTG
ncbi:MAG: hypothetical protein ACRDY4_06980 [Acidimicrobiia bacterium]